MTEVVTITHPTITPYEYTLHKSLQRQIISGKEISFCKDHGRDHLGMYRWLPMTRPDAKIMLCFKCLADRYEKSLIKDVVVEGESQIDKIRELKLLPSGQGVYTCKACTIDTNELEEILEHEEICGYVTGACEYSGCTDAHNNVCQTCGRPYCESHMSECSRNCVGCETILSNAPYNVLPGEQ